MKQIFLVFLITWGFAFAALAADNEQTATKFVEDGSATNPSIYWGEGEGEEDGIYHSVEGEGEGVGVSVDNTKVGVFTATGWTGGTSGTHTGAVSFPAGSAAAPSIYPTGDTNTGIYSGTANTLYFSTDGTLRITLGTVSLTSTLPYYAANGTAAAPSYDFSGDVGNGMFLAAANTPAWASDGVQRLSLSTTAFTSTLPFVIPAGAAATPSIYPVGDSNTGLWASGADTLDFSTGGTNRLTLSTTLFTSTLPIVVPAGSATAPAIYPTGDPNTGIYSSGADTLNATTNGVLRLSLNTASLTSTLPYLTADGSASATAFGFSGDAGNGMYLTGADTIGFPTGGTLRLSLSTTALTSTLPYVFPAGTEALPSLYPTGDPNTGLWSSGADALDWSTGGTKRLTLSASLLTSTLPLVLPVGAVGAPSQYFSGDPDTGPYTSGVNNYSITTGGVDRLSLSSNGAVVNAAPFIVQNYNAGSGLAQLRISTNSGLINGLGIGGTAAAPGDLELMREGAIVAAYNAGTLTRSHSAGTYADTLTNYYEGAAHNTLTFRATRGTSASPDYLDDDDIVCKLKFEARDGSGTWGDVAEIRGVAAGDHASGDTPGGVHIYGTKDGSDTQTKLAAFESYIYAPGVLNLELPRMDTRMVTFWDYGSDVGFGYFEDVLAGLSITVPDGVSVFDSTNANPVRLHFGIDDCIYFGNGSAPVGVENSYKTGVVTDAYVVFRNDGSSYNPLYSHNGTSMTVHEGGVTVTSGDLTLADGDVVTSADDAIYLGDPATNGTWRIIRDGDDLVHQRRESDAWVTKQRIED